MVELKDTLISSVSLLAPRVWYMRLDVLPFWIMYTIGFSLVFLPENEEVVQVAGIYIAHLFIYSLAYKLD